MDFSEFLPWIDVKGGLARLMNNKKLYARLLKKYMDDTNFESIVAPLTAGDLVAAHEKIHAFKGVSSNLSIAKNYELSKELEAIVKERGDFTAKLSELRDSIESTAPAIAQLTALFETT